MFLPLLGLTYLPAAVKNKRLVIKSQHFLMQSFHKILDSCSTKKIKCYIEAGMKEITIANANKKLLLSHEKNGYKVGQTHLKEIHAVLIVYAIY